MRSAGLLSILLLAATVGACGQSLTPNMTGTGGIRTGTGLVTGTGGFVTGTGGTGGAITGTGGSGGSASICDTLVAEYHFALSAASSCTVGGSGQCQQLVSPGLSGCGCTYVNDGSALAEIEKAWVADGCATSQPPCEILCVSPASYSCVSTDGGSNGVCSYNSGTGGITGTGGFTDTGGTTGSGGVTGSGGFTDTGGTTGSGGLAVDGGALGDCDRFAAEYAAVLIGARSCTPNAAGQCGQRVPPSLSPCTTTCVEAVTDSSVLGVIRQEWEAAGCANAPTSCPQITCQPTGAAVCAPSDAGGSMCSPVILAD
jgi:hypothetical protein